jgi:CRP/FNR family transcriptional regulator
MTLNTETNISPTMKAKLMEFGNTKKFEEGEIILNENSYIKAIPIVLSGSIKVHKTEEDGREILLYYIRTGESCIMSFLGGIHQDTSKVKAIAEEACEILFIPIEKVTMLIHEFPEWLDYIFKLYHKRFEELLDVVNAVTFKRADERLLKLLSDKSENLGEKEMHITHEELALELGTVRVVVSRLLKQLEHEGQIKLGRNKITLLF